MELNISNASDFSLSCSEDSSLLDEEMSTLTTELKDGEDGTTCTATITSVSVRRVRVVVSLVGKLVLPAVVGVYYAYLRNKHTLSEVLPTVVAFLTNGIARSLSSVQGAVTNPTTKIDPLLRVIKLRYRALPQSDTCNLTPNLTSSRAGSPTNDTSTSEPLEPDRCVTCTVLCEPSPGEEHTADVVFVHGLHGSLVKTWRQGDWKMAKERAESVEMRRRASLSCLQNCTTPRNLNLKRCASTNSSDTCLRTKIPKDDFSDRTFCDCEDTFCTLCRPAESGIPPPIGPADQRIVSMTDEVKTECWPRDWLPKDCPGVRVIALTYTTDPYLWRPVWVKEKSRTNMEERSHEMMEQLLKIGVGKRPIVWVGHSKGGLFVKQLIVDAWERRTNEPNIADICLQTKAIMFYSVPHKGSSLADFKLPFIRQSVELLEIKKDCNKVLELHNKFLRLMNEEHFSPEVFSFIETSLTFMAFLYIRIVTFDSCGEMESLETIDQGARLLNPVLRCQPKEVYCFIADFLDALMVTRENAKVAALFVEDVTEAGSTLQDILLRSKLNLEEAVRAVRIIQRAFRRHLASRGDDDEEKPVDPNMVICKMILRLNISYDKASECAKTIQHAWRIYKIRMANWKRRFSNAVDWKTAARYTLRMYKKYAANYEYTHAATIIQAAYRGYYTRRIVKCFLKQKDRFPNIDVLDYLASEHRDQEDESSSSGDSLQTLYVMYDPDDKSAQDIQKTFKRYLRKSDISTIANTSSQALHEMDAATVARIKHDDGTSASTTHISHFGR